MAHILKRAWWVLLLRGTAAILFALLLLIAPGLTLATGAISFTILFALYALVDGIGTIVAAIMHREGQWFLLLIMGAISVFAGLVAFANPLLFSILTLQLILYIFAFKAIAGGIVELISAWRLRQDIDNEWLLALNGLFSVLFGLILLFRPILALEALITVSAFYLLIAGVLQIVLAFKMRHWNAGRETSQTA